MTGALTANGTCSNLTTSLAKTVTLDCSSKEYAVNTKKHRDNKIIPTTGVIEYAIATENVGSNPTTNTFVLDKTPVGMLFSGVLTSGSISPTSGLVETGYNCN